MNISDHSEVNEHWFFRKSPMIFDDIGKVSLQLEESSELSKMQNLVGNYIAEFAENKTVSFYVYSKEVLNATIIEKDVNFVRMIEHENFRKCLESQDFQPYVSAYCDKTQVNVTQEESSLKVHVLSSDDCEFIKIKCYFEIFRRPISILISSMHQGKTQKIWTACSSFNAKLIT